MKGVIKHKLPETREEWLRNRFFGIGGSDAGTVLGLNPYKSAFTLWCEKTHKIDVPDIDNESMRQGRDLEEYVAKRFEEETGKKVRKSGFSFQSKKHPFMLANVDRLVVGEKAGLECKTANALTRTKYDKGDIPASYYAQCMHYMAVTGLEKWYIAILVLGKSFHVFEIQRDEEEIQALIEKEKEFWNCVKTQREPPIEEDGSESTSESLLKLHPSAIEGTNPHYGLINNEDVMLFEIKEKIKNLKEMQKAYENTIKQEMGKLERLTTDNAVISWKNIKIERFDTQKFKKEMPDLYEKYLKVTESRRFVIKKIEGEGEKENGNN